VVDRFYKNSLAHTVMENIPNKDIKKALKDA
jgi:hypothetical protein